MNFVILLTEKISRECVLTGRGLDYFGKKNVSKNGKTCLSWKGSMCENNDKRQNYCLPIKYFIIQS